MTTVQESPNGHLPQKGHQQDALFAGNKVLPPPCSLPDLPDHHRSKDSSDNNSNPDSAPAPATSETDTFAANAYRVPPKHYAPKANSYQGDDSSSFGTDPNPLPERCQFMFSDGRQCTMARSDIHPSLCRFHAEREDQLFGDPAPGGNVVGRALDLPELYSACRDLTTASGVNRALGQVFRLLAQRRISRQEAATFGHLAQLLLRSISAMRVLAGETPAANVYLSAGESHGHQELSPVHKAELRGVHKDHQECRIPGIPEATAGLSPVNKVAGPADQQGQQVEQPSSSRESPRRERHGDHECRIPASRKQLRDFRGVNKVVPSEHREPRRAVCVPDGFAGDPSFASPQPQPSTASMPSAEDPVGAGKQPALAADTSSAAAAERTAQRKPIPTTSVDEGSTSSRSLSVAHAAPPNPQPSRNEHLRNRHPQVAHNEHLQNLET